MALLRLARSTSTCDFTGQRPGERLEMTRAQGSGSLAAIGGLTAMIALLTGLPAKADELADLRANQQLLQQRIDQLAQAQAQGVAPSPTPGPLTGAAAGGAAVGI